MVEAALGAGAASAKEEIDAEVGSPSPHYRTGVTLMYDPPYENDLDDALARHLVAYLVPAASLRYKAKVWASCSFCRFDFLIDLGTRRVAIDYTDTPDHLETALVEDNDALALGSGSVDVVVRVRRADLEERFYDAFHLLSRWEPSLFTPYGQRVFARGASDVARSTLPEPEADVAAIYYGGGEKASATVEDVLSGDWFEWPDEGDGSGSVILRRMSREQPRYWRQQYERASLVYGRPPMSRH